MSRERAPRRATPRVLLAAAAAGAVLVLAVADVDRTSPGPVTLVHARAEEVGGGESCSACHGGLFDDMTDACLECHADIAADLEGGEGLHGVLAPGEAPRCAACHSEHHGPTFAMVNARSFALAGVPDREAFDHGRIGFAMDGRHLEIDCVECHASAREPVLPEGGRRFRGLDASCTSCHEDAHEGAYVIDCVRCHSQAEWTELRSTGHDRHLPLVGGHAGLACTDCHAEGGERSLDALGRRDPRRAPRACADCHASPHAPDFAAGVAARAKRPLPASCVLCHEERHESFAAATVTPERHALAGFPLDPPHAEVACADCHAAPPEPFAERYPGRGADQCHACHADVHGGQFAEGPFAGGGCLACHERERWEPHAFDAERHERAALALDGRHLEIDCAECHARPAKDAPRVFRGTPSACAGCHADAHRGAFERHDAVLARAPHGSCARCHDTESFGGAGAAFDHGRWTRFALRGAHEQAACEACHPRSERPDDTGRTLGFAAERFGPYAGCETCHADPHGGDFDDPALPREVEGRAGCARCHVESSFRAFPEGFDHGRWTGFDLEGAHEAAGCEACHAPLPTPAARPDVDAPAAAARTWERAAGARCADCHVDPHAGQFERAGTTTCERCHVSAVGFSLLVFDHEVDALFRLGEQHAGVACAACHPRVQARGVPPVVRYRPIPFACVDCHGIEQGPTFRRKERGR